MKKYDKVYVKRDPATGDVIVENGEPILNEVAKHGCPLEERHVAILNRSWKKTGVYYAEVKEESKPKSDARLALEQEATELGISFRDNIGDEKLQEKINKAIES
jgi:hypothetical protein